MRENAVCTCKYRLYLAGPLFIAGRGIHIARAEKHGVSTVLDSLNRSLL